MSNSWSSVCRGRTIILASLLFLSLSFSVSLANAEEKIRVACVGDSITKGAGAAKGESYPDQLGKLLGERYEVRNFGANGATMLKGGDRPYVRRKELGAALAFKPNIVIIKLGTNDAKAKNWKHKATFATDLKALIQQFRALPSTPKIFVGKPTTVAKDNFGISGVVIRDEIWPLVDQVAKEEKVGVIDFAAPLADKPALLPDGVHPNAEGYARLAEAAKTAIVEKATP
ncbi:MAG: sialate O-acetylesterase [Planctomycetes bacterium]|nr:sialate O-acetylesterase [Planctomycetota bacterium]